ncbi:hypothetical protein J9874_04064 (plasmid) [Duffyella gerundensis]|uniref:hypothetical protein n=1 Tax=Duffyella gerundensis TaxID=1619313 RepID=UPI001CE25A58|nr:hypothetical protein [Duffyella gerundensis]UCB33481.1 hypothetical protein J9874_04064 [Duffyella gerundensis]
MNLEWLKIGSYIFPVAATALNYAARFKTLTNERISVYKDIKPLCTATEMKPYEIKAIDKEIKNLILFETTGIRSPLLAQQHLKILSCNDITDFEKSRIKKLSHCIDQDATDTEAGNKKIIFTLNKKKYYKRRREGAGLITAFLVAYYTLFFTALRLPEEEILLAAAMLFMSLTLIYAILKTVATYPMFGFYKNNKKIVDSLDYFPIE